MTERRSSENGQHGGPGLPMFCGVIGAGCFAMAAMTILMAGQMSTSQKSVGAAGASNGIKPSAGYAVMADRMAR